MKTDIQKALSDGEIPLEMAKLVLEEYPKPDSLIDAGNLYFAGTTYRDAYLALKEEFREYVQHKIDLYSGEYNDAILLREELKK